MNNLFLTFFREIMKNIYKLLPFFIVEFLAKRFCEKTTINNKEAFIVFNNTYILKDENR